jgi:hypothetical protein
LQFSKDGGNAIFYHKFSFLQDFVFSIEQLNKGVVNEKIFSTLFIKERETFFSYRALLLWFAARNLIFVIFRGST